MTTEVDDIVQAKDETDWAMDYSDELNRRVKAERRWAGAVAAMSTVIRAYDKFLGLFMAEETNAKETMAALATLHMEVFDTMIVANLFTYDPPQKPSDGVRKALCTDPDEHTATDKRVIEEHFASQRELLNEAWKQTCAEWSLICQENGMNSIEEAGQAKKAEFLLQMIKKATRIKAEQDGKKQSTETH